jgi:hypothetical protein
MDDWIALIVASDETAEVPAAPAYRQRINERYEIWFYPAKDLPPLSVADYSYTAIPKCYGLTDSLALEESGILQLQKTPTLSLMGQGVFVAIIDTGIRYQDAAFLTDSGKSRIYAMWDQTAENPEKEEPEGLVQYGRTYAQSEIDRALSSDEPEKIVPEYDSNGHGTFLASVACGSSSVRDSFTGAAPEAELIVVKLREAPEYLKDFFAVPADTPAYAENDIMAAVAYAERVAKEAGRPLALFLGLGTNHGGHTGTTPLCSLLNTIAADRHRAVISAVGNEGNERHHYFGTAKNAAYPAKVEINAEKDMPGLWVEVWTLAPEQIAVAVQSPTGELAPKREPFSGESGSYSFLFEGTQLTIDYRYAGRTRRDQLVYLRFSDIKKGLWTIRVYPQNAITGEFHAWLPMKELMDGEAFFLESTPDVTLTSPADAAVPMAVAGYDSASGALYYESGRGPDADGVLRPDFAAPAVELTGRGLRDNYVTGTGTSGAAAVTAGACAQILEWAVVRKNALGINSVDIKNLLCRSAKREQGQEYPSTALGYGKLDVYAAFETIRG